MQRFIFDFGCAIRFAVAMAAFGLSALPATAEEVDWLYQVDVPVESQAIAARNQAAGLALTEVLQRTSGQASLPDSTRLRLAVSQPDRYYNQFRYVRNDLDGSLQLRVNFSSSAIASLSRDLQLPVWWSNRPRVLLWALAPDGQVLTAQDEEFGLALQRRARQRGIPLVLPEADETGVVDVSETAVRRADLTSLAAYSSAYAPEIVAAGSLAGSAGNVSGRFTLSLEGNTPNISVRAQTMTQLGGLVADRLTDLLAARFAVAGQLGEVTIAVSGVSSPRAYADLLRYLGSLAFVDAAQVRELANGQLRLALETGASRSKLLQLLAVDGLLMPDDAVDAQLNFRDRPNGSTRRAMDNVQNRAPTRAATLNLVWLGSDTS